MIIDVHSHIVPPAYVRVIASVAERDPRFARLAVLNRLLPASGPAEPPPALTDVTLRLEQMDDAGVDLSAISVPPPGPAIGERSEAARAVAEVNDDLISLAEQYPNRLRVLVNLPMPHVDDALEELKRVGGHDLVQGVELMTVSIGYTLDEPGLEPVYQAITDMGLPVLLHPALEPLGDAFTDYGLLGSLAPMVSSSLGTLRLVLSGMLDRVPRLDLIVPHLGGVIPYLTQRITDLSGTGEAQYTIDHYLTERLYLDTVSLHPPAFDCAARTGDVSRLVLGSDAPFRGPLSRAVDDIRSTALAPAQQQAVLGGTASRWFS